MMPQITYFSIHRKSQHTQEGTVYVQYAPVTADYAMEWNAGGYFLHNAPWRGYFGKGANNWHWDPLMGEDPGTHGCVDVPTGPMSQLYSWADIGTTVQINP